MDLGGDSAGLAAGDAAGIGASALCLAHCALGPFIGAIIPSLGLLAGEEAEIPLLSASFALSGGVVCRNALWGHRRWRAAVLVALGAGLLVAARARAPANGLSGWSPWRSARRS